MKKSKGIIIRKSVVEDLKRRTEESNQKNRKSELKTRMNNK